MRLQKRLSRIVDGKEYAKWIIVIPPTTIENIGWQEGEWLTEEIKGNSLLIRPLKNEEIQRLKTKDSECTYKTFKEKIRIILNKNSTGLSWTQIREIGDFSQKVPNNKWVKKLEEDINLLRIRDRKRGIVWKLDQK